MPMTGSAITCLDPRQQVLFVREIGEARHLGLEGEFDGAGRAVALLADDDFGLAVRPLHAPPAISTNSSVPSRGCLLLQIIFLAEDEHHDVGVLLDRAGFAQVRQLRALVVAAFDLTRQLRQRDDRHVQLLGQRLEARW